MEGSALVREQNVLVVGRSEETGEVLATALGRQGVRTFWAARTREGLELVRRIQPNLIVLDLEVDDADPESVRADFVSRSPTTETPIVLLGSVRKGVKCASSGEFVPKPYHYGPLIRRIEELLRNTDEVAAPS